MLGAFRRVMEMEGIVVDSGRSRRLMWDGDGGLREMEVPGARWWSVAWRRGRYLRAGSSSEGSGDRGSGSGAGGRGAAVGERGAGAGGCKRSGGGEKRNRANAQGRAGAADTWLENEPPNSITSWDDLVSKFLNRFLPHSKTRQIKKEITNSQQVFADQDSLNTAAGGNLMTRNTQEALTIIENKSKVQTCRNKLQVSSSGGSLIQNDAITAHTKQVKALISSMQEAYNRNQEASIQLMQTQMGQMEETFQERSSCVPPSNTETYPQEERKAVTTMSGLTLDGSFIPHSNFLFYQEKEQEPETITEVVEIDSSQSTPLVPPPETPPLSTPKPKEDPKPNPHHLSIPYLSRLQEEKF
ncbi:reverse transcriptase domain-containing protein [Tanacetum coccineum]